MSETSIPFQATRLEAVQCHGPLQCSDDLTGRRSRRISRRISFHVRAVVFGSVIGDDSMGVVRALEAIGSAEGSPSKEAVISSCGVLD